MANVKISQLTAKGSNLESTDRLAIAEDAGGGTFASKYITGSEVKNIGINTQTNNYTVVLSDAFKLVEINKSTAATLTININATVPFPIGTEIKVAQLGAGQITITPGIGVTINSSGGANKTAGQYAVCTLIKRDTNIWYLFGDITT